MWPETCPSTVRWRTRSTPCRWLAPRTRPSTKAPARRSSKTSTTPSGFTEKGAWGGDRFPETGIASAEGFAPDEIVRCCRAAPGEYTLVSPGPFFDALRTHLDDDAQLVVDDGKHTFLAAELFPVQRPRGFISPTDFNCMGYCVPAAVGTKLANPGRQVAAIVGDGAFLMTGMELLTAAAHDLGVMAFVFHDGELGQISQFQSIPLNRKTCTKLSDVKIEGVAKATGAHYVPMETDADIAPVLEETCSGAAGGQPVIVDVNIDYRRRTQMTKGVVKTNLGRFSTSEKIRFVGRAAKRHLFG